MSTTLRAVTTQPVAKPTREQVVETVRGLAAMRIAPDGAWTNDHDLRALGLDSLSRWELAMAIEDDFDKHGVGIIEPDDAPADWRTVNTIAEFVVGRIGR